MLTTPKTIAPADAMDIDPVKTMEGEVIMDGELILQRERSLRVK